MIKTILIYIAVLAISFSFAVFYYAWFSSFLLIVVLCLPLLSLICSLPFMIFSAVKGFTLYAPKVIYSDDSASLNLSANTKNGFFCPLVKIRIKAENSFCKKSKKIAFEYSGLINKPVNISLAQLGRNCGCIKAETKWLKIYDMLGIFFIPVRFKHCAEILAIPRMENSSEDIFAERQAIIGYKKKSGGGFSDDYEIREYHNGDSLRSVHWKLSAKHDNLMVREPSLPIYKSLKIMLMLTDNPEDNNKVMARFADVCHSAINNEIPCAVCTAKSTGAYSVNPQTNIYSMYRAIYTLKDLGNADTNGAEVYSISADSREVAE